MLKTIKKDNKYPKQSWQACSSVSLSSLINESKVILAYHFRFVATHYTR
ncbi:hypothetical protein HB847_07040 [Listeria booriae]|uniref:Uncharacterized protein n=1 Tax=Listeria booriae TaxID=1552123 RepID=A0A841Y778_9LIST|nr:hypothetical protein [Listeria booriae]MBC1372124.1 hypothetical protein [Listeria booriae]